MRALSGILAAGVLATLAGCGEKPATKTEAGGAAKPAASAPASLGSDGGPASWPKRKPGLWTQTMTLKEQGFSRSFRFCVDEATDEKLGLYSDTAGDQCAKGQMTRTAGGGWRVTSTCDMGTAGRTQSTINVTGDFGGRYVMEIDSTTTGAAQPAMNGQHKMTMTAEWSGACPAGWAGGDMEMPGGRRMNLLTKTVSGGG
jgi:hypothetical protein